MSQLDVRQLPDAESLAEAPFPSSGPSSFRVHLDPEVHRGVAEHAAADTSVEICGVLVGEWRKDSEGPYAVVTNHIQCEGATSKFAEVTFTHESWAQINREMDSRYSEQRIIGWYHSHPDFGIFLSDRDCFIQENFFSGPGQIAYVVDPVRRLEGVFDWRAGKPEPVSHYWGGDRIVSVQASEQPAGGVAAHSADPSEAGRESAPAERPRRATLDVVTVLGWLSLFLLGYLLAGAQTSWQRSRMVQGAVAHYGVHKLMRVGFEQQLKETRERLELIDEEVESLLDVDQSKLDDEQAKSFADRRQLVQQALALSRESLKKIEDTYGYTDLERAALASYIAAKQAELTRLNDAARSTENNKPQPDGGDSGTSPAPSEQADRASDSPAPPVNDD